MKLLVYPFVFSATLLASTTSFATLSECHMQVGYSPTSNIDCAVSSVTTEVTQGSLTVNEEGFFGLNEWNFAGQVSPSGQATDNSAVDIGLSNFGITNTLGFWAFDTTTWQDWDRVMLTFSTDTLDANDQEIGLIGFEMFAGVSTHVWTSPFESFTYNFDIPEGLTYGVDSISAYVYKSPSTDSTPIPTPQVFGLLVFGLLTMRGLNIFHNRKTEED